MLDARALNGQKIIRDHESVRHDGTDGEENRCKPAEVMTISAETVDQTENVSREVSDTVLGDQKV